MVFWPYPAHIWPPVVEPCPGHRVALDKSSGIGFQLRTQSGKLPQAWMKGMLFLSFWELLSRATLLPEPKPEAHYLTNSMRQIIEIWTVMGHPCGMVSTAKGDLQIWPSQVAMD